MEIREGRKQHGGKSDHGPALATLAGGQRLVIGWAERNTHPDKIKFCVTDDGLTFERDHCTQLEHHSTAGVALANWGDRVVAAWVESPNDRRIRVIESDDGLNWSAPTILNEESKGNPGLGVVFPEGTERDSVCLAWTRAQDERLCLTWKSTGDQSWHETVVTEAASEKSPHVYGIDRPRFGLTFHLVYRRNADRRLGTTPVAIARDGTVQIGLEEIFSESTTDRQPATLPMRVFPGKQAGVYFSCRNDRNDRIGLAFGRPGGWTGISVQDTCVGTPALGRLGDFLVLAWSGYHGDHPLFTYVMKAPG